MFFFGKKNQKTFARWGGLVLLASSQAGHAQPTLREACAADYHQFCAGVLPGGGRIIACFAANDAKLSAACKTAIAADQAKREAAENQRATAAGDMLVHITVDGVARSYLVHKPNLPAPASGFPLLLVFHGAGGQGGGMVSLTHLDTLADQRGFIAVYPNGLNRRWNDGRTSIKEKTNDTGFTRAMLDDLAVKYPVDTQRIFAAGMSNGAMFTQRLGCEMADRISGIAAIAGSMPNDIMPGCHPAKPVAVLQIGGTADPIVPFGGGKVSLFGGLIVDGTVMSATATAEFWAQYDGCATTSIKPEKPGADGISVTRTEYGPCRSGRDVRLLAVNGGGHVWPGGPQYLPAAMIGPTTQNLDASAALVDFFLAQTPR